MYWNRLIALAIAGLGTCAFLAGLTEAFRFKDSFANISLAGPLMELEPSDNRGLFGTGLADRDTPGSSVLSVTLAVDELDPTKGVLRGILRIRPARGLSAAIDALEPASVSEDTIHDRKVGRLTISVRDEFGSFLTTVSLPLKSLMPENTDDLSTEVREHVTLQLFSFAERYPNDVYILASTVDARLTRRTRTGTNETTLPFTVGIQLGPNLDQMKVEAQVQTDLQVAPLVMTFSRAQTHAFYVYLIALTPALLVLLLAHSLFLGAKQSLAWGLEAAVGLIAILPLRQVLVPNDIAGITFLDRILGLQVVAVIALVGWRHARWVKQQLMVPAR